MRFTSLLAASIGFSLALDVSQSSAIPNKIQLENRQPGTTAWQLTNPADARQIEGYASLTSVPVGGNIQLFVNTQDSTYSLIVYRMGWYGGKGGRKMLGPKTLPGVQQVTPTTPPNAPQVLQCHWTNPFTIQVPASWLSGIYLVKLHGNRSGKESYIIFTVRDSRRADLVYQQSVITYQAYNSWPEPSPLGGFGHSLYDDDGTGQVVTQASFNRPYGSCPADDPNFTPPMFYNSQFGKLGIGAGDFLYHGAPAAMDFDMVRWLEHQGYDVTYITDVDTHEDVNRLLRAKGFLSGGHDEYWSEAMKSHVVQARDLGVSLGFLGGNYMFWPVDLRPDANGFSNRTISLANNSGLCSAPPCDSDSDCPVNLPTCDHDRGVCTSACMTDSDCPTNYSCQGNTCRTPETGECNVDGDCPTNLKCRFKQCNFTCMGASEQTVVGGLWVNSVPTNGDIVVQKGAPLDHWIFANTGLKEGDVIPGLIGVEYNGTDPNVVSPNGLLTLLDTQAPRFESGLVMGNGGYPLPDNFNEDFNGWYDSVVSGGTPDLTCEKNPIFPMNIVPPDGFCSNPWPATLAFGARTDWTMTLYQASSAAFVFNAGTNQWSWGLDDYFTGLTTLDGANNGPSFRVQCGYPWFHPGLVSCRSPAIEQITRNVLNRFINP
jgi:hypothetical protein